MSKASDFLKTAGKLLKGFPKAAKNIGGFFSRLVRNGTGWSSKSFFLVTVTLTGCAFVALLGGILVADMRYNRKLTTDLTGISLCLGGVGTIFTSAGLTKAFSEKYEGKNDASDGSDADDGK